MVERDPSGQLRVKDIGDVIRYAESNGFKSYIPFGYRDSKVIGHFRNNHVNCGSDYELVVLSSVYDHKNTCDLLLFSDNRPFMEHRYLGIKKSVTHKKAIKLIEQFFNLDLGVPVSSRKLDRELFKIFMEVD